MVTLHVEDPIDLGDVEFGELREYYDWLEATMAAQLLNHDFLAAARTRRRMASVAEEWTRRTDDDREDDDD